MDQSNKYKVNSVVEAFSIIDHLLDSNGSLGLTQLSKRTRISKNKTFRMLTTLEQLGMVEKDPQSNYSIGYTAFATANKIQMKMFILDKIRRYMKEMSEAINEATYFASFRADKLQLVDYCDCSRLIKVESLVGRSIRVAAGVERLAQSKRLDVFGDFMIDVGGFDPEVTAVIAPINVHTGNGLGALVVVAPSCRMQASRIDAEIVPSLQEVVQQSFVGNAEKTITGSAGHRF